MKVSARRRVGSPLSRTSPDPAARTAPGNCSAWQLLRLATAPPGNCSAWQLLRPDAAVLAFDGQLHVAGWLDSRPDGSFHAQDLAWGSADVVVMTKDESEQTTPRT